MNHSIKSNLVAIKISINELKKIKPLLGAAVQLNFPCVHQQQTNWCWAAVTQAINAFKGGTATQCQIASGSLGRNDCCTQPGNCNIPYYLDRSLTLYNLLRSMVPNKYGYNQIRNEISAQKPVGVRLGWNGGGGHFVTVYGYQNNANIGYIAICDPWYGISVQDYINFPNAYQGGATWSTTYLIN